MDDRKPTNAIDLLAYVPPDSPRPLQRYSQAQKEAFMSRLLQMYKRNTTPDSRPSLWWLEEESEDEQDLPHHQ
jgi:hypothetical protein